MAGAPDGTVSCAWLDLRSKRTEIYAARSKDGGATWDADGLVYRSPDGSVCQCCHPSAAFGPDGSIAVLWRNNLKGARDLYHARFHRRRPDLRRGVELGRGTWPLNICPMDGGAIAVGPERSGRDGLGPPGRGLRREGRRAGAETRPGRPALAREPARAASTTSGSRRGPAGSSGSPRGPRNPSRSPTTPTTRSSPPGREGSARSSRPGRRDRAGSSPRSSKRPLRGRPGNLGPDPLGRSGPSVRMGLLPVLE